MIALTGVVQARNSKVEGVIEKETRYRQEMRGFSPQTLGPFGEVGVSTRPRHRMRTLTYLRASAKNVYMTSNL